jgi:hypothetical protein
MIISDTKKSNELMDIPGQSNYLREKGIDKTHPLSA